MLVEDKTRREALLQCLSKDVASGHTRLQFIGDALDWGVALDDASLQEQLADLGLGRLVEVVSEEAQALPSSSVAAESSNSIAIAKQRTEECAASGLSVIKQREGNMLLSVSMNAEVCSHVLDLVERRIAEEKQKAERKAKGEDGRSQTNGGDDDDDEEQSCSSGDSVSSRSFEKGEGPRPTATSSEHGRSSKVVRTKASSPCCSSTSFIAVGIRPDPTTATATEGTTGSSDPIAGGGGGVPASDVFPPLPIRSKQSVLQLKPKEVMCSSALSNTHDPNAFQSKGASSTAFSAPKAPPKKASRALRNNWGDSDTDDEWMYRGPTAGRGRGGTVKKVAKRKPAKKRIEDDFSGLFDDSDSEEYW